MYMKIKSLSLRGALLLTLLIVVSVFTGIVAYAQLSGSERVYRFWNDGSKHHFYTIAPAERDHLIANDPNWSYEGPVYYAFPTIEPGSDPLYRFWSENFQGHFYTRNTDERDTLILDDPNWLYEGVAYYVVRSGAPVYRFWSDVFKSHFFTSSSIEKAQIESNDPNWIYEGIAYYSSEDAPIDAYCGSDHGQVLGAPPQNPLCSGGMIPSDETGSGPWQWTCLNTASEIVSICQAETQSSTQELYAVCGSGLNQCSIGIFIDAEDTTSTYEWGCIGSGGYDTFAECSLAR